MDQLSLPSTRRLAPRARPNMLSLTLPEVVQSAECAAVVEKRPLGSRRECTQAANDVQRAIPKAC